MAYGTHLPLLIRCLVATQGPVLELGMGYFSTPVLHLICGQRQRKLVSLDNAPAWAQANQTWRTEWHRIELVEDWAQAPIDQPWGLAFVDHRPARRRREEIQRLADLADIIVVHDTEPQNNKFYQYQRTLRSFKFRYDDATLTPWTTAVSNCRDLSFLERP